MKIADMSRAQKLVAGLQILEKYASASGKKVDISADHDIIYAGTDNLDRPEVITSKHRKQLEALGWGYDKSLPSWYKYT